MTKNELLDIKIEVPDRKVMIRVKQNWDKMAKPLDSFGSFENITSRIGAIQGTTDIDITKKAVIVMCADNGIVEEGISQSGQEVTLAVSKSMGNGRSSVGKLACMAGADVVTVDIGINCSEEIPGVRACKIARGTKNFRKEPAMTEKEVLQAIETGMKLVYEMKEKGYGILATGEMGIGNTTTSTAVAAALLKCDACQITGRGAGLSDEGLCRKQSIIQEAVDKYELLDKEPLEILRTVGGLDIAGLTGVFIGGAVYHMPIVTDGVISAVAGLLAQRLCPGAREYMIPSHMSREVAMKRIMEELELKPVIDAGLALGEGTGAVMLFALLDMVINLYKNQTTFADIVIEPYKRQI